MRQRFRLYRRKKGGRFYLHDDTTGKQESLGTSDRAVAQRLLHSRSEAVRQPAMNLQMARVYLMATDEEIGRRTWQYVMDEIPKLKKGNTQLRWLTAIKDKAFDTIRHRPLLETHAEHLLRVLQEGKVSTNVYLRRIHNFAVDMNWLPWPVLPKKRWPAVEFKGKRAITWEEHGRIVARELNPERKAFYQLAWLLGASQTDLANLQAEDIDWQAQTITFFRMKTLGRGQPPAQIRIGKDVESILVNLPKVGPLFPYLRTVRAGDRATEFKQRCGGLGIQGVTLHSYRYAWAERAKSAGYPERYAQLALGHNSKAVHRAYAKNAQVTLPALEDYERQQSAAKVIQLPVPATAGSALGAVSGK
jgi:integrase